MDWFVFLFTGILWVFFFNFAIQKATAFRSFIYSGLSLVYGVMFSTGISWPSGMSITTAGNTTTQTLTFTTYLPTLSGTNSFPILFAIQWGLILLGIIGLLYTFIKMMNEYLKTNSKNATLG
jgi:hypothetical protein